MIFPFIGDATNLLQVDAHAEDSINKIVAIVIGGDAAIAAAFHEMDSSNNHHEVNNTDNDGNSLPSSNTNQHAGALF